jgi:hypothetical protein
VHRKARTAAFRRCLSALTRTSVRHPSCASRDSRDCRRSCRLLASGDPALRLVGAGGPRAVAGPGRCGVSTRRPPHRQKTLELRPVHAPEPAGDRPRTAPCAATRDRWSPKQLPDPDVSSRRYFQTLDAPLVAAANTFRSPRPKLPLEFRHITRPCRYGGHFASSMSRQPIGDIDLRRDGSIAWATSGGCAASVSATEAYTIDLCRIVDARPRCGERLKAMVLRWGEQGERRYAGVVQPTRHDWLSRQPAG